MRDDDERALSHFETAAQQSETAEDRERATWGEFVAAVQLERPAAHAHLEAMREAEHRSPAWDVRVATGELLLATRFSGLRSIDECIRTYSCYVNSSADPLIHTSFLNHYAHALTCAAHYDKAQEAIAREGGLFSQCALPSGTDWISQYLSRGSWRRVVFSDSDYTRAQAASWSASAHKLWNFVTTLC